MNKLKRKKFLFFRNQSLKISVFDVSIKGVHQLNCRWEKEDNKLFIEINDEILKRARNKILKAPALVAVTTSLSPNDLFRQEEDYAASVCAIHNFILSLWGQGIGCQWSTGSITRHQIIYDALGLSHEKERIIGLLKIGYPEKIPEPKKKELSQIRFYLD